MASLPDGMPEDVEDLLRRALHDATGQSKRREMGEVLSRSLTNWGVKLHAAGSAVAGGPTRAEDPAVRDELERTIGLSCVIQVAGELGEAAIALLQTEKFYAAWALLRQLVECEYLCWAFSEGNADAQEWLHTTGAERRKLWQPRHMRERSNGRFRSKDYGVHCEVGGHPTPRAFQLLTLSRTEDAGTTWLDLINHLARIWEYSIGATSKLLFPLIDHAPGPFGRSQDVTSAIADWRASDSLLILISRFPDFPDLE